MQLVLHREIPDDSELRRRWDEVVLQMENPQVFYTWEWAFAVQSAYGKSLTPFLLLAYEGDQLVGVASLATPAAKQDVNFLAAATSDYCDFVSRPEDRPALVKAVLGKLREAGSDRMTFASIPEDSSTTAVLPVAAGENGYHAFGRHAQVCAQVILGSGEKRVQLRTTLLGKKLFRRSMRSLEASGRPSLIHLRSRQEIEANLAEFMRSHIARFLVTQRISNLIQPERRLFLEELGRLLSDSGWVCLSRMGVQGRAVAWNYGFQFGASWFWYQPTFDTRMDRYSPGYCLLTQIVSEACEGSDLDAIDLGVGAEGYKERFANGVRPTLDFSVNRALWPHSREIIRHAAARAVKLSPKIEGFVRRGLDYSKSWRKRWGKPGFKLRALQRLKNGISEHDEVFFYEWPEDSQHQGISPPFSLEPLSLELLAEGATYGFDDSETINYLLRATQRLHREDGSGFALTRAGQGPVHYCWIKDFEGFYMDELKIRLTAPAKDAVMIYDCWTPLANRGHGYYGLAISRVAEHLRSTGKAPWIFSAARNSSSVRGVEKSGFERRHSLVRRKVLFWQKIRTRPVATSPASEPVVTR